MAAEARGYLKLAAQFLRPRSLRLDEIGGLSGTGKSTLAAALAPSLPARVLRSDVVRKRLFEVAPETRLPTSAYTARVSLRVYQTLRRKAANTLAAGYLVIVDAVSLKPGEISPSSQSPRRLVSRLQRFGSRHRRQQWIAVYVRGATMPRMRARKTLCNSFSKIPGPSSGFV